MSWARRGKQGIVGASVQRASYGPSSVFSAIPRAQDALPPFHPRPARDRFVGARLSQRFQEGFSL